MKSEHPYQSPEGYFEQFGSRVTRRIDMLGSFNHTAESKNTLFTVPETYFSQLLSAIQQKIKTGKGAAIWQPSFITEYALACILIASIGCSFWAFNQKQQEALPHQTVNDYQAVAMDYLMQNQMASSDLSDPWIAVAQQQEMAVHSTSVKKAEKVAYDIYIEQHPEFAVADPMIVDYLTDEQP